MARTKVVDPRTYAKNVLKSAGYIGSETIKGVNPTLTQFFTDSTTAAKDMYNGVRNYKSTIRNKVDSILGETGYEDLKKIKNNALDDLRTGKFYNKEREDKFVEDYAKANGLSFDFDDFDDLDKEEKEDSTSDVSSVKLGNMLVASQKAASNITSSRIVKGSRANTAAMIAHSEKMTNTLNASLANINTSILMFRQDLATPLNTHIINSSNFYQVATNELATQTKLLENIYGMLNDHFAPPSNAFGATKKYAWKEVMGYSGIPSLRTWGKAAKDKLMNETSLGMLSDMLTPEMAQMIVQMGSSSPISTLLTILATDRLQNGSVGRALNRTVGTIRGGMMHKAVQISNYAKKHKNDGTLKSLLANIFDIIPSGKSKIDFSKYNKGRAEWTGKDQKALQEVIPTYLSEILATISGKEAKIFDYNTGRFVTHRKAKENFEKERRAAVGGASANLRSDVVNAFIAEDRANNPNADRLTMSSRAVRNLSKTYDSLMSLLAMNNADVSMFQSASSLVTYCRSHGWIGDDRRNTGRAYILDENSVRRLAHILFSRRVGGVTGRFEDAVISARIANAEFVNNSANSSIGVWANGSGLAAAGKAGSLLDIQSKSGKSVFDYLESYYRYLGDILDRMGNTARANSSRRVKSGRMNRTSSTTSTTGRGGNRRAPKTRVSSRSTSSFGSSRSSSDGGDGYVPLSNSDYDIFNYETEEYEEPVHNVMSRFTRERQEKETPISRGIDKINGFIDKLFYGTAAGENGELRHHGLAGMIKDLSTNFSQTIKDAFDNAKNFVKNFLLGKWEKLKSTDGFKSYISEMKNSVVDFGKGVFDTAKEKAAKVATFAMGRVPKWAAETSGSRRGGQVTKSGMISVSEGEAIIPADKNPFYKGHKGNAARDIEERSNYQAWLKDGGNVDDFFGMFRQGKKAGQWQKLSGRDKNKIREMISRGYTAEEIAKKISKPVAQIKQFISGNTISGTVDVVKETAEEKVNDFKNSRVYKTASEALSSAIHKLDSGIEHLVGNPEKYKNAKDTSKQVMDIAKKNLPKTMASGTLGALVGAAATGSGLGLLGGFVIGAGSSVLKNSDELSKKLFGEEGADGTYSGGKLPSKVATFIKKRFPKVAKTGALGAALGTLGLAPGGILGGFAIGAGLELASTTNVFNDIMFGHKDVNGKRQGGLMGSIKLHVVDPLIDFTKGGIKKIADYVKENFFDPMKTLVTSVTDFFKVKAKQFGEGVIDFLFHRIVDTTIGQKVNALVKPVSELAGKVGKGGLKLAGAVASAPFRFVGNTLGGALEQHNIRKGYSSKSIEDRMAMEGASTKGLMGLVGRGIRKIPGRENSTFGRMQNSVYTKWAAGLKDEERDQKIIEASRYLNGERAFKNDIISNKKDLYNTLTASLDNAGLDDPKELKRISKMFNSEAVVKNNDFSEIEKYVRDTDKMGQATKDSMLKLIEQKKAKISGIRDEQANFSAGRDKFFSELGLSDKELKQFIKTGKIQSTIDANKARKKDRDAYNKTLNEAKSKDNAAKLLKEQEEASPIDTKRNNLLSDIKELILKIAKHSGIDTSKQSKNVPITSNSGSPLVPQSNPDFGEEDQPEAADGAVRSGTYNGKPIQEIYREKERKWVPNMNDADTKRVVDEEDESSKTRNKFYNMFIGGGLLSSLKGLLNPDKKEDDKPTLWDKVKDFFTSKLGSVITTVGSVLGTLGTIAAGIGTVVTAIESIKVVLGLGDSTENINNLEDRIRGRNPSTYKEGDYMTEYETSRFRKRVGLNIAESFNPKLAKGITKVVDKTVGRIPIIGKGIGAVLNPVTTAKDSKAFIDLLKESKSFADRTDLIDSTFSTKTAGRINSVRTKVNKLASKVGNSKAFTAVKDKSLKLAKSVTNSSAAQKTVEIAGKLKTKIAQVLEAAAKKLGLSGKASALAGAADDIATKMAGHLGKAAGKLKELLPVIGQVIYFGQIVLAVTEGAQSARAKTILGILEDPTPGQRILAAVCNGINWAIPGIGGLIPTETILDIVFGVLSGLGVDFGDLAEQRVNAKATVAAYNQENGTTYNIEEYIHNVQGDYTILQSVKKTTVETFGKVKNAFSGSLDKAKTSISKGIDSVKTGVKNIGTNIKNSAIVQGSKELITKAGEAFSNGKNYIKDSVEALKRMNKEMESTFDSTDTEFKDVIAIEAKTSEDNPLAGITKTLGNVAKINIVPMLFIKGIGKKIYRHFIEPAIKSVKDTASATKNVLADDIKAMVAGDFGALYSSKMEEVDGDNPIGGIVNAINFGAKIGLTGPTAAFWIGHKIKNKFDQMVEAVKTTVNAVKNSADVAKPYMDSGDLSGLWGMTSDDGTNESSNPMKFLTKVSDTTVKLAFSVPTMFKAAGNKISELFSNIREAVPDTKQMISDLWKYSDPDVDFDSFDSTVAGYKTNENGIFGSFGNGIVSAIGGVMKLITGIVRPFRYVADIVGDKIEDIKDWAGDTKDKVVDKYNDVKTGVSNLWSSAKDKINTGLTNAKNWLARGSNIHTTQKGNTRRFGNATIDENGCGPAAATTVLRAYGRGIGVNDAAAFAEKGGYVAGASGVGTRASYFRDILGRNGIRTAYTDSQAGIKSAVASGNPTVLLGQDASNRSKANSPFGPNPHYVVARGTDKRGNIIVDDPELNGTAVYSKNILKKTKLGVATGGASGVDGLISTAIGGIFSKAAEKLGDTAGGKILRHIFGGFNSNEEETYPDSYSTSGSFSSGSGDIAYGENNLFKPLTSAPNSSDKFIKLYNNSKNGGISKCVSGSPSDSVCNVLSNCVGWACARFNHIYNLLTGNTGIKFPNFCCNAEKFIEVAKEYGLSVGLTPQIGAIMCWQKGMTLESGDGAGHVAVVEQVISGTEVVTSESGYNANSKFWSQNRKKGNDGNWGQNSAYKFRGFIYNPAVTEKLSESIASVPTNAGTTEIWKWLHSKGLTDSAKAGIMGCWQAESSNKSNRVEGDYLKSYPGSSTVMATRQSLNDYTKNILFPAYARSNISINKSGYMGEDGNYYPGIGLAQWTGPRAYRLLEYAKQKGKHFGDTNAQLDYFWNYPSELPARTGLVDKLNASASPEDAATIFLDRFEMNSDKWHTTSAGAKQNRERRGYARSIYDQLKGITNTRLHTAGRGSGLSQYMAKGSTLDRMLTIPASGSDIEVPIISTNGSKASIPVTYNFTGNNSNKFSSNRNTTGSASQIAVYTKQLNELILYVKQLVTNTGYNASIPTLVDVMNQSLELLAAIGSNGGGTTNANKAAAETDFAESVNQSINIMKAKLETIAKTL